MAEVLALVGTLFSQAMTAATATGSFLAANAGTIGTALSVGSTIYGGIRGYETSKVTSAELKKKGDRELAVAQRDAERRRRETNLLISRQQAVASASGAGASDPSVKSVMEKTQAEGDYNAQLDMYNGMVSRADAYHEAAVARSEGRSGLVSSFIDAGRTIYTGISDRRRQASEGDYGIYGDHYINGVWS